MGKLVSKFNNLGMAAKIVVVVLILLVIGSCSSSFSETAVEQEGGASAAEVGKGVIAAVKLADAGLDDVELAQTTEVLEYSGKTVDPLTLVTCANSNVDVSAEGSIDLSRTGERAVTYRLSLGKASDERILTFTVRDTKAPTVAFADEKVTVQQGGEFDPLANIVSVTDPVDGDLLRVDAEPEAIVPVSAAQGSASHGDSAATYESGWYLVSSTVDISVPGEYPVTVTAMDVHGNRTTKDYQVVVEAVAQEEAAEPIAVAPAASSYVLNTNSHKFHHPWCSSVKQMSAKNRQDVEATREDVVSWGYDPCQKCNP